MESIEMGYIVAYLSSIEHDARELKKSIRNGVKYGKIGPGKTSYIRSLLNSLRNSIDELDSELLIPVIRADQPKTVQVTFFGKPSGAVEVNREIRETAAAQN